MEEEFEIGDYKGRGKEGDFEKGVGGVELEDLRGEEKVVDKVGMFVKGGRVGGEGVEDVLLDGGGGLGKRRVRKIIGNELGVGFKVS